MRLETKSMKHAVIVDDSTIVRERLFSLLSECPGVRIVGQAGNGREARFVLEELRPEVVILDIRLPEISGIQLLKEIKAAQPETVVIMLTNYDFEQYREQCMQLGADYFFNKAREFEKVVEVLAEQTQGCEIPGS
jgi:DNA-binding NarL/FixJ family response regulator